MVDCLRITTTSLDVLHAPWPDHRYEMANARSHINSCLVQSLMNDLNRFDDERVRAIGLYLSANSILKPLLLLKLRCKGWRVGLRLKNRGKTLAQRTAKPEFVLYVLHKRVAILRICNQLPANRTWEGIKAGNT